MTNDSKIFVDGLGSGSADNLASYIKAAKQADVLTPITVIGPSVYANLSMRHNLGRSGFANVRFLVFPRLSEFLGAPSLASENRRPLTSILEGASIRAVSGMASGMLGELRSHPSTHQSLRNSFRQLRHASDDALDILSEQSELRKEVVSLYRRFREQTREFYDREDLARAAAKAVTNGRAARLADLGAIIFFQIRDVSPAERELIEALSSKGHCAVFMGISGDTDADAPVEALTARLSASLGEPERLTPAQTTPETQLLIAPDPHQEIRWMVRNIVKQAEDGVSFNQMAVLYRKQIPYSTLISEELRFAGIPVAGPNPSPLSDTAVGRTLTGLIELSRGELTRDAVSSWLTGCPVKSPVGDAENFSPSRWDAISKKAGVVKGLDQWTSRLQRYADEMERLSDEAEGQGEISEARAALMKSDAVSAKDMLEFVTDLSESTSPPANGSRWTAFTGWASGLLDRYLVDDSDMPAAEQEALVKIKDILSELSGAEAIEIRPTFATFSQALDDALLGSLGHIGVTGQGVFVAPLFAAIAMSFDTVHIVGMIEGAVPPSLRDDPLIPDRERQAAGGTAAGLPLQQAKKADERYVFLSALATASKRVLSFPVADPAGGRGHYPSRWFLEQASALEGTPVYSSTLWSLGERPWLTVLSSMEQSLASVANSSPADAHDYNLERLWNWKNAGLKVRSHPLVKAGSLAKSLSMGGRRYGKRLTEWDGNLSSVAQGSRFARRLSRSALSPTSLERWAKCPFSYFLGNVLGISSLDVPEEIYSMTPLERGSLGHEIPENFIRSAQDNGTLPKPNESWSSADRDALRDVAESAFRDAESRGVTGKDLMWRLDQVDILTDLDTFLEEDSRLRERFGVSPKEVEARFGLGDDSWPEASCVLEDGTTVRFRGIIDRVDSAPDGKMALVVDYKTGGASSYSGLKKDPVDRGRRLQLGVYSLAAQKELGPDAEIKAAYWFITNRGNFALNPSKPVAMDEIKARFTEVVSTIVSGIRSGLFPANPGKESQNSFVNCGFCEFDSICPSRRDSLWTKKKNEPVLENYLKLSEPEED